MKGNSFGRIFRVNTWGESHGPALGVAIDGCPAGIPLTSDDFIQDISFRQGGQGPHSTPRREPDSIVIESGLYEGKTTGTPLVLRILNANTQSGDYDQFRTVPRPGHADFTTHLKHGHRDHRGGGRSSARETVARVAAGVVAKKILAARGIHLLGFVRRIGTQAIPCQQVPFHLVSTAELLAKVWPAVESARNASPFRLPCAAPPEIETLVAEARASGDSWGGSVECWVRGLPAGLGEPVFDKLNAVLAHALLSLPAAVSVEFGGGKRMSEKPGSEIRDPIVPDPESAGGAHVGGNRHGGLLGGITTGEPLWMQIHFHAPTSVPRPIMSVDLETGEPTEITVRGRHDSVPLPRAVPMVEAMAAIVLVDAVALHSGL